MPERVYKKKESVEKSAEAEESLPRDEQVSGFSYKSITFLGWHGRHVSWIIPGVPVARIIHKKTNVVRSSWFYSESRLWVASRYERIYKSTDGSASYISMMP